MGSIQAKSSAAIKPQAPAKAPQAKPKAVEGRGMTTKDVLKLSGKTAGGAVAGVGAVAVQDLFFHFGNNGGTGYKGGVYAAGAIAGAAIGAALGYRKFNKQQEAGKAAE